MSILIDRASARAVLLDEANRDERGESSPEDWLRSIKEFSEACEAASKTHIAMLGTALLAKSTDPEADAFSVKEGASSPGAYSARGLGHGVLVPCAPELGINLGVTGREPLNNQPYFRIQRATLEELIPLVRGFAQPPVKLLVGLLTKLDSINTTERARGALRAFIHVRRTYQTRYSTYPKTPPVITPHQLIKLLTRLVSADSEGGKRAQAAAAGIMDAVAGDPALVDAGRINDPDRHFAGDVGVLVAVGEKEWARVFEVRDKAIGPDDVTLFAAKLAKRGFKRGAILAMARSQSTIDVGPSVRWAEKNGVQLVVFFGWREFVEQALFWSGQPAMEACTDAYGRIRERLIGVEASLAAVALWDRR